MRVFLQQSFSQTFWQFEQFFCLLAEIVYQGCYKWLMLPHRNNLRQMKFFESFLFFQFFNTKAIFFGFWQFRPKRFPKLFFTCPEEKRSNIGFSRKSSFFEQEQLNFLLENFLKVCWNYIVLVKWKNLRKNIFGK